MRTYLIASTIAFIIITTGQLARLALRVPVLVNGFNVPLWASGIAVVVLGGFAVAGMQLIVKTRPA